MRFATVGSSCARTSGTGAAASTTPSFSHNVHLIIRRGCRRGASDASHQLRAGEVRSSGRHRARAGADVVTYHGSKTGRHFYRNFSVVLCRACAARVRGYRPDLLR